ncbi:MAG: C10 family peptidase [Bacteroidaceae bacterium]|nr:C10 family peptidase [Bacteroidaceae bacterium]
MKKNFIPIIALLTIAVASCTENIVPTEVVKPEVKLENRAIEEIIQIAQNAPSLFESKDETRGTTNASKEIDLSSITSITNKDITRTSSAIDTLLYVMNYADNKGYVIVSSKQGTPGVIAYIEEGQYDLDEIQNENTDIGYASKLASAYVASQKAIFEPRPLEDTFTLSIGPLLETAWGQHDPEGIYCPNGLAGCANTAMAQIMAYYKYPDTLQLTYDNADRDYQVLNWDNIKLHKIRHTIPGLNGRNFCIANTETHNAIGRLCRQLGELNLSDYWDLNGSPNPFGTDTREPQMKATARSLGFTVEDWKAYNDTCLLDPLLDRHPVVVSGIRNDTIGHMWVVDGFLDMTITSYSAIEVGQPAPVTYREIYNHVNWGWDGRSNGYFLSNIFNVGNVYHPDPNVWGATNTSYIYNSELIYFEFYRDLNILN